MTAFKNGRAALAVTAGLVGALSLGSAAIAAAPVSAYAEASTQDLTDLQNGTVTLPDGNTTLSFGHSGSMSVTPEQVAGRNGFAFSDLDYFDSLKNETVHVDSGELDYHIFKFVDTNNNHVFEKSKDHLIAGGIGDDYRVAWQNGRVENGDYVLVVFKKDAWDWTKVDYNDYAFMTFNVARKQAAKVSISYNGPSEYTGQDLSKYVEVTATTNDTGVAVDLKRGEDYDYYFVNQKGEVVDKIVDAGKYYLRLVNTKDYTLTGDHSGLIVDLKPLTLKGDADSATWDSEPGDFDGIGYVRATGMKVPGTDKLTYTGSEIAPTYQFASEPAYKKVVEKTGRTYWVLDQDKTTWVDLPAGNIDVRYVKDGKKVALKEAGDYTANVTFAGNANIYGRTFTVGLTVSKDRVFTDVASTDWFADAVYDANTKGYMTGLAGTATFDPYGSLTRGQAVQVLYNMAGGREQNDDFAHSSQAGFKSYDDVASGAWYAEAVAWAKAYGVVNGYPDGTFRAEQAVSREEFAQMLRNYAAKTQQGTDASADLSSYTDASQLGWSKDAVSWAVANKVMGQGVDWLQPGRTISRAEVAKMVTSFQPDGKLTSSIK